MRAASVANALDVLPGEQAVTLAAKSAGSCLGRPARCTQGSAVCGFGSVVTRQGRDAALCPDLRAMTGATAGRFERLGTGSDGGLVNLSCVFP